MEYWNNGILGEQRFFVLHFDLSIIPSFHYSIIPICFFCDLCG